MKSLARRIFEDLTEGINKFEVQLPSGEKEIFYSLDKARDWMKNNGCIHVKEHPEEMADEWKDKNGKKAYITYWD